MPDCPRLLLIRQRAHCAGHFGPHLQDAFQVAFGGTFRGPNLGSLVDVLSFSWGTFLGIVLSFASLLHSSLLIKQQFVHTKIDSKKILGKCFRLQ